MKAFISYATKVDVVGISNKLAQGTPTHEHSGGSANEK